MYLVKFMYFDDKDVDISVNDEDLEKFLNSVGENKIYFNDSKTAGTWLNAEQVRYFQCQKINDEVNHGEVAKLGIGQAVQGAEGQIIG